MSESPTKPSPEKASLNIPLVVVFSFLLCFAIPILPLYLWRKNWLSAAWGIGLAVAWFALYVIIGFLVPQESKDSTPSAKPAAVETTKSTPKPTHTTKPTPTPTKKTTTAPTPTQKATTKPKPCADVAKNVLKNPAYVFKCQFGNKWPLTVSQGIVACRDKPGTNVQILTFFDPKGKEYALNGIASGAGYPKIDPIWRDNEFGAKVDIGPLIDRASKVCD